MRNKLFMLAALITINFTSHAMDSTFAKASADRPGISHEMTGRPDEQTNSSKRICLNNLTTKQLTSMELAQQHGYIGYLIKRMGTTYDDNGKSNNNQLPSSATDLIIKFCKDDLLKIIPLERLIQPQLYEIPIKEPLCCLSFHPIKLEVAVSAENLVLWDIEKNSSCELPIDKPIGKPSVTTLTYSPRGKFLAAVILPDISSEQDIRTLCIWNLATKQIAHSTDKLRPDGNILFTNDETQLVMDCNKSLIVWDLATDRLLETSLQANKYNFYLTCRMHGIISGYNGNSSIILWNLNGTSKTESIKSDRIEFHQEVDPNIKNRLHIYNNSTEAVCIQTNGKMREAAYCPRIDKLFFTNISEDNKQLEVNVVELNTNSSKKLANYELYPQHIFCDDGSKLIQWDLIKYKDHIIVGQIAYIDLVPDLNKFTVEQLRAMANEKI